MRKKWRRYEVLLPRRFNDGSAVPKAWLAEAVNEVVRRFGAVSFEKGKLEGRWSHEGKVYRDILARLVMDVPDLPRNRQWLKRFKARWKTRLQQLELWIVSYRIDVE
jgi:hypothetical protein